MHSSLRVQSTYITHRFKLVISHNHSQRYRKSIEKTREKGKRKKEKEEEEEKLWNEWMDICMERYNAEKPTNIHLLLLSKVVLNRIGFGGDEV